MHQINFVINQRIIFLDFYMGIYMWVFYKTGGIKMAEVALTKNRTLESSLYHIEATDTCWVITDKKTGNKKNVSYLVAPKDAEEEFLAGIAYGMFNR